MGLHKYVCGAKLGSQLEGPLQQRPKGKGVSARKKIPGVDFFFPRGVPSFSSRPGGRTILGCRIIIPRPPCLKEEDAPETKIYEMEV